jgi:hypothetical protein
VTVLDVPGVAQTCRGDACTDPHDEGRPRVRRGDHTRALTPLRQALRLARGSGSADRMTNAVELAAHVLQYRGRAREVATLVGAVRRCTCGSLARKNTCCRGARSSARWCLAPASHRSPRWCPQGTPPHAAAGWNSGGNPSVSLSARPRSSDGLSLSAFPPPSPAYTRPGACHGPQSASLSRVSSSSSGRACSAVIRDDEEEIESHSRGRGFDSPRLHSLFAILALSQLSHGRSLPVFCRLSPPLRHSSADAPSPAHPDRHWPARRPGAGRRRRCVVALEHARRPVT